jgi:ribosome maturation factor RimP
MSANVAASSSGSSVWERVRRVAEEVGVELFDIDFPSEGGGHSGVLRVYIMRTKPSETPVEGIEGDDRRPGVSLEDCARVSKKLIDIDEQEGIIPDNCSLEVSSPGINRRLRLPDHFRGAVGERVKVKYRDAAAGMKVITGILKAVSGDKLEIAGEEKSGEVVVDLAEVKEARVDFRF